MTRANRLSDKPQKPALEVNPRLSYSCPDSSFPRSSEHRPTKEKAMRKVLLLALVSMFFATACSKSEEPAPAPESAASAAAPAASAAAPAEAASAAMAAP